MILILTDQLCFQQEVENIASSHNLQFLTCSVKNVRDFDQMMNISLVIFDSISTYENLKTTSFKFVNNSQNYAVYSKSGDSVAGVICFSNFVNLSAILGILKGVEPQRTALTHELVNKALSLIDTPVLIIKNSEHYDSDTEIVYVNNSFENYLGYSCDLTTGKSLQFLFGEKTDTQRTDSVINAINSKINVSEDLIVYHKSGEKIETEISICQICDVESDNSYSVAVFKDKTESNKLMRHLQRKQRLESIGSLSGGIAHDLNNIFTPLKMSLDAIRISPGASEFQDSLTLADNAVNRGVDLVNQILLFSKGGKSNKQEIQADLILKQALTILGKTLPKGIRLNHSIGGNLWKVIADPTQLNQIIMNVCINSKDAILNKSNNGYINIKSYNVILDELKSAELDIKPGNYVCFEIEDNGCGIEEDKVEKVFNPFFTSKEKGTGLGLATVESIVRAHDGSLSLYTENNVGTNVMIYLPAILSEIESMVQEASQVSLEELYGDSEKILLVDDEPSILEATRTTLELSNYCVECLSGGLAVLAKLKEERFDLLITDLSMPSLNGVSLVRQVQNSYSDMPIIMCSGIGPDAQVKELLIRDKIFFLKKPYETKQLLSKIKLACSNK